MSKLIFDKYFEALKDNSLEGWEATVGKSIWNQIKEFIPEAEQKKLFQVYIHKLNDFEKLKILTVNIYNQTDYKKWAFISMIKYN